VQTGYSLCATKLETFVICIPGEPRKRVIKSCVFWNSKSNHVTYWPFVDSLCFWPWLMKKVFILCDC